MDLQTGHLEDRDHEQIYLILLFTMNFFCFCFFCLFVCFFFNKLIANFQQKTIAFWYKKIQRLLLKGVLLSLALQDVGKIFK